MRLSEVKGEAALDLLADIIEPTTEIMSDQKVKSIVAAFRAGEEKDEGNLYTIADIVKVIIKEHKKSIIEILATLNGEPVEQYEETINIFTLPAAVLELLSDPDMVSFFTSQEQIEEQTSSIAPTENIEEKEK